MEKDNNFWIKTTGEETIKPLDLPLTESEVKIFNLDENDISLIKILKNKFVRSQLYEQAAKLRDIENKLSIMIDYAKFKRDEERTVNLKKEYQDSLDFGDYILRNFVACTWWTDTTTPSTQVFGYTKNNSHDTFTTEQVYQFYLLDKMKKNITPSKENIV